MWLLCCIYHDFAIAVISSTNEWIFSKLQIQLVLDKNWPWLVFDVHRPTGIATMKIFLKISTINLSQKLMHYFHQTSILSLWAYFIIHLGKFLYQSLSNASIVTILNQMKMLDFPQQTIKYCTLAWHTNNLTITLLRRQ